ncbi:MAG: GDP-L-fucose synthase, partial [Prevotella sp.]|nr:GDP-L-fucose synthase [Prevotella sp.]
MSLSKDSKIYVAGHKGLVGSAIWKNLENRGYHNLIGRSHKELDLTDQNAVKEFFDSEQPDAVVLAAAFVGGIMANSLYRADFIMQNMKIQCNVISNAYSHNVKKLLFLGSTCIYPKNAPQPMKEDALLTSPLEYTNEEYAIAKIAGLKMCESYNLQYGTNYIAVMPTNLYGPNDNFHLENSHVMPAMMRKIYLAKLIHENDWDTIRRDLDKRPVEGVNGSSNPEDILNVLAKYGIFNNRVALWGTGSPLREFLWSEDMADASVHILLNIDFKDIIGIDKYSSVFYGKTVSGPVDRNNSEGRGGAIPALGKIRNCHINVGTGKELTIKELASLITQTV